MTNIQVVYSCSNCGAQYPKWQGRCLECGKWGTLIEEEQENKKSRNQEIKKISPDQLIDLSRISAANTERIKTGLDEFDRVLGGGIVSDSLVLLGGDPGMGKSTLALQLIKNVTGALYVSGEESAQQVKLRAERLGLDLNGFKFLPQTNVEKIMATARDNKPPLVIIDSIQTIYSDDSPAPAGSVSQITACTAKLIELAKFSGLAVIIIGHVTKDGLVAGPKTLEHLVDAVLYLENDSLNYFKILRSVKNRFGSTGEIGIFEMTASGLKEISNPTEVFWDEAGDLPAIGTISTMVMEGSRAYLIEIQALVNKTSFGYAQRKATGFDPNRLQMILAVLAKAAKLNLANYDVYLNVAGGLKIRDTGADLAVALAVASALLDLPLGRQCLALGEIGLSGEVRAVPQLGQRLKEAEKFKFKKIIAAGKAADAAKAAANLISVRYLAEAIKEMNGK